MSNPKVILGFCVVALALGYILYIMNPTPTEYKAPVKETLQNTNQAKNNSEVIPSGSTMEDGSI